MSKYRIVAYFLWLVGGWFGVHHFYLGRDKQGILWITSFSGYFGIGWIRDFFRIPAYVRDANSDPAYVEFLGAEMRYYKRPSIYKNIHRIIAQVLFGYFYRMVVLGAIPEEYGDMKLLIMALGPLGTAFGTYMVSNVGRMKSRLKYSIIGAYVGELLFGTTFILDDPTPSLAVVVSMAFSTYGWEFDRSPQGLPTQGGACKNCCKRLGVWTLAFLIFYGLTGSYFYFNASVTTEDGETIKIREAVNNFLQSPAWEELKQSVWKIFEDYQKEGWNGAKRRMVILADVEGEERSQTVLGVERNATLKEIKEKYRVLAKEWHPDHHQNDSEEGKLHAQEKFMEIKEAYETLTKIHRRRESKTYYRHARD